MKALEKDRTRRYASASEFAAEIGRHLSNEPVMAGPPSFAYRVGKTVRRHRGKVAAAAALAMTVLVGLFASTALYVRANHERAAAEWQGYKAQLAAANADIDAARFGSARDLLLSTPPKLRGWEWKYLYWLSDTSLTTLNTGETGFEVHMAFSPDGSRLLVSTASALHAWELGTFRRTADYGPFRTIRAMSRDGTKIVCLGGGNGNSRGLEIVDPLSRSVSAVLEGSSSTALDIVFSGDGSRLATLLPDHSIWIWDTATGRNLLTIPAPAALEPRDPGGISHDVIALNSDGKRLASSVNHRIVVWDGGTGRSLLTLEGHRGNVQSLGFSRDDKTVISISDDVRIWDLVTGKSLSIGHKTETNSWYRQFTESPDSTFIATGAYYQHLEVWDRRANGELAGKFSGQRSSCLALAYSPDGKYLISLDQNGLVKIWDARTFGGRYFYRRDQRAMSLSPDGKRLLVSAGRDLEIWDARSGNILTAWRNAHQDEIGAVAWDPRGEAVASGSRDKSIAIWNPGSSSPRNRLLGHEGQIVAIAYSPDGTQLASGSRDQTLRFWDTATGMNRVTRRFQKPIQSLTYSPDGSALAITFYPALGIEAMLQTVNVSTGDVLTRFEETTGYGLMKAAAFSPDGERIVSGDAGFHPNAIWDAHSGKLIRRLGERRSSTGSPLVRMEAASPPPSSTRPWISGSLIPENRYFAST